MSYSSQAIYSLTGREYPTYSYVLTPAPMKPRLITTVVDTVNVALTDPKAESSDIVMRLAPLRQIDFNVDDIELERIDLSSFSGITVQVAGSTTLGLKECGRSIDIMAPDLNVNASSDLLMITTKEIGDIKPRSIAIGTDRTNILVFRDTNNELEQRLDRLISQASTLTTVLKVLSLTKGDLNSAVIAEDEKTGKLKIAVDTGGEDDWQIVAESSSEEIIKKRALNESLLPSLWQRKIKLKDQEEFEDFGKNKASIAGGSRIVMEINPNGLIGWKVFDDVGNQSNLDGFHQVMQTAFGNLELVCTHKNDRRDEKGRVLVKMRSATPVMGQVFEEPSKQKIQI